MWLALISRKALFAVAGIAAFAIFQAGFYFWASSKGKQAIRLEYAIASQKATESNAKANLGALGRELTETRHRADIKANTRRSIQETDDAIKNDIAPITDQLFYDSLRSTDNH